MLELLFQRFRARDRRALARLLTLLAKGQHVPEILRGVGTPAQPSRVVAITGSGGVGKSTLVGKLIEHLRDLGQTVAVLACDPESPLSGGALLGDRFRMPARPEDEGAYIRSLAAAPGHGAVAEHVAAMIRVLEAFPFDVVLLETVGAGQGDTAVRALADVVLLLLQPETGDDLQWEKAGVFEIADVIAIHKADLPGAANTEAHVHSVLGLVPGPHVDVVRVSSRTGEGIAKLWEVAAARPLRRVEAAGSLTALLPVAQDLLADWFAVAQASRDPALAALTAEWGRGQLPADEAARELLRLAAGL
jgi:LAO/AO transport system ATPase